MSIAFLCVSVVLGFWLSYIWSSRGGANCLVKTMFSLWTIWGLFLLAAAVWPSINAGQIKLI